MSKIFDVAEFRAKVAAGDGWQGMAVRLAVSGQASAGANDAEARTVSFVFSDGSVDRYGDTIDARGWVLDKFRSNPVALFGHDAGSVENVIGRALNVRVEGDRLLGEIEFASAEENANADVVYRLVKGGYLNAVSVGFQPIDWTMSKDKSRPGGIDFKKQELLEISIVPIPANGNALAQARAAGIDVDRLKLQEAAPREMKISRKGLYEVSWLAELLASLGYLEDWVEYEAEMEGDGSDIPARLTDALKALGQILIDMTAEEVAELLAEEDNEEPVIISDEPMVASLSKAQKAVLALVRMARVSAAASVGVTVRKFEAKDIARLFNVPATDIVQVETRAGKVLSAANKKALSDAHGHMTQACDMVKGVIDMADADEPDDDGDEAKAIRERRARARKAKVKLTAAS